jgi:hypothetical protein
MVNIVSMVLEPIKGLRLDCSSIHTAGTVSYFEMLYEIENF